MRIGRKWRQRCQRLLPFFLLFLMIFIYRIHEWNSDLDWEGWPHSTLSFSHHLCVVVPFRDRDAELTAMAPHVHHFLTKKSIKHTILVMNQTDGYRFNRASLINIGYNEGDRMGCDYMAMHDVDLIPLNEELNYEFPGNGVVRHISAPGYHPKYNYTNFIGGILMLTTHDFRKVNGMSNKYWGWGLEDDELFLRIRDAGFILERPSGLSTNKTNTFRHIHDSQRKRDYTKKESVAEKAEKRRRDRNGGLNNLVYTIANRRTMTIEDAPVHFVDVRLFCEVTLTPYCLPY